MPCLLSTQDAAPSSRPQQAAFAQYELEVLPREHFGRSSLERFIADGYARAYGAHIVHFADVLVGLSRGRAQWVAGVGYTIAGREPLFSEQYIDQPIEEVLGRVTGISIPRRDIVEVGNLFALGGGAARQVIVLMTGLLNGLGRSWVVSTLTKSLLNSFLRLGIVAIPLVAADPQRLTDKGMSWGSYYAHEPCVMTASIRAGFNRLVAAGHRLDS